MFTCKVVAGKLLYPCTHWSVKVNENRKTLRIKNTHYAEVMGEYKHV